MWRVALVSSLALAVLVLLGRALWWLPGPVNGLLPDLGLDEGGGGASAADTALLPSREGDATVTPPSQREAARSKAA